MVTILIPTHNRPSYLVRCIYFLSRSAVVANVIVADSSEDAVFERNSVLIDQSCIDKIRHLDCRGMVWSEKLKYFVSAVDTPFVVLCGDDDFVIPSAVDKCACFLNSNPDYSHAHGRILTFRERNSVDNPVESVREYPQIANEVDVFHRLVAHFSNYTNNFYSVHRTDLLLCNIGTANSLDIGRGLRERLLAVLDVSQGKRKMIPDLFMVRQKGITGVDEYGKRTLSDNPQDADYFESLSKGYGDYNNFLRMLVSDKLDGSPDQVNRIMECVERDFGAWRRMRTLGSSFAVDNIFRLGYRKIKQRVVTFRTLSTLSQNDINGFLLAVDALRKFYMVKS